MNTTEITQALISSGMANITVACSCNKCADLDWIKMDAPTYAALVAKTNTNLSDIKSMRKLNHSILQNS